MKKEQNVVIKKGYHCRGMLSAISLIRLRKQAINSYLKTTKQKGDSQQKPLGMTPCFITTRGFTLIELLVVVLIIGILAAVAVPQYQKAVAKTRISRLLPIMKSIESAQETYKLANGQYADTFSLLDIDIPTEKEIYCYIGTNGLGAVSSLYCKDDHYKLWLEKYYKGQLYCQAQDNMAQKLCKFLCNTTTLQNNRCTISSTSF